MADSHIWVARARCAGCGGYLWSNPGSPNVDCCAASIVGHVVISGEPVTDDEHFIAEVARETSVDISEVSEAE